MEWFVFALGTLVVLLGAFGVVTRTNPVHAAVSLVGTFFGIAVLFIAQDAEFLAAMQVIVYAGAIVVLFLFVIMLLGVDGEEDLAVDPLPGQRPAGALVGAVLAVGLAVVVLVGAVTGARSVTAELDADVANPVAIGRVLFTDHLWAFEITSLLLIIAVVGAVALARHRPDAQVDDDLPGDALAADGPDADDAPASEDVTP